MTLWHILLKGKRETANRNNETSNNIRIFKKPQTGTKSHLWLFYLSALLSRFLISALKPAIFNLQVLPHPLSFIQPHLISYHRDEFAVGGLSAQVMDGIAKVAVQRVHISPVPCHLDGVADGALHPAGGGAVFLGDFRVQAFCHGVDVLRLVHGEQNGVPQELVYNR